MKFDVVLIGGGLSSLACGIRLQKAGKKCLIVSAGQNAFHFSSASFGLLGKLPDGTPVDQPLAEISKLPAEHPYSKIGVEKVTEYVNMVPEMISSLGIPVARLGEDGKNLFRPTATGTMKRAWIALKEAPLFESKDEKIGEKALIVNFAGFLDFNSLFIAEGLEKKGLSCRIQTVKLEDVEKLRKNPSEMRSVNIARVMDRENNWKEFAHKVKELLDGEDVVVLPQVFGFNNPVVCDWIAEMIPAKVLFVCTMAPSVPGIRTQRQLKSAFENLGGTFLGGDVAIDPEIAGGKVKSIRTANLGNVRIEADNFVLASGNLFGKGLVSTIDNVTEPVFGLDVDYPSDRSAWYDQNFFATQAYCGFGVRTDSSFHPFIAGSRIDNLYVVGSEVGGCNPLAEGSGAGVALLTALHAADQIIG